MRCITLFLIFALVAITPLPLVGVGQAEQPATLSSPVSVIVGLVDADTNSLIPISEIEIEQASVGTIHVGPFNSFVPITEYGRYDFNVKAEGCEDVEFQIVITVGASGQLVAWSDNPTVQVVPIGTDVCFLKIIA